MIYKLHSSESEKPEAGPFVDWQDDPYPSIRSWTIIQDNRLVPTASSTASHSHSSLMRHPDLCLRLLRADPASALTCLDFDDEIHP